MPQTAKLRDSALISYAFAIVATGPYNLMPALAKMTVIMRCTLLAPADGLALRVLILDEHETVMLG